MLHVRLLYPLLQLIRSKAEVLPSMTDLESRIWSWLNECIRIWLAEGYCIFKHVAWNDAYCPFACKEPENTSVGVEAFVKVTYWSHRKEPRNLS